MALLTELIGSMVPKYAWLPNFNAAHIMKCKSLDGM